MKKDSRSTRCFCSHHVKWEASDGRQSKRADFWSGPFGVTQCVSVFVWIPDSETSQDEIKGASYDHNYCLLVKSLSYFWLQGDNSCSYAKRDSRRAVKAKKCSPIYDASFWFHSGVVLFPFHPSSMSWSFCSWRIPRKCFLYKKSNSWRECVLLRKTQKMNKKTVWVCSGIQPEINPERLIESSLHDWCTWDILCPISEQKWPHFTLERLFFHCAVLLVNS